MAHAVFSTSISSDNMINYADYEVESDNSIWPFPSISTDDEIVLDGILASRSLTKTLNTTIYSRMMLFKSSTSLTITRSVQKNSSIFSCIAGLFGTLAAAFFLLKIYTDYSFEISLTKTLFFYQKFDLRKQYPGKLQLFQISWNESIFFDKFD